MTEYRRSGKIFNEQLASLIDEVSLALQWNVPLIIFAIYRSEHVLSDGEAALRRALAAHQQTLQPIQIEPQKNNLAELVRSFDTRHIVFSISGLGWGGGADDADVYRLLNLHREYFIENKIRMVVWMSESESQRLSQLAPDFWAFRHRVLDFSAPRAAPKRYAGQEVLSWYDWPLHSFTGDEHESITYREGLLADLPEGNETLAMRVDILTELASLQRSGSMPAAALHSLQQAVELAAQLQHPESAARLWLGIGILFDEAGLSDQAGQAFQQSTTHDPHNPVGWSYLAGASRREGRRTEALNWLNKALKIAPDNAQIWNELGNVKADLGRAEQAIQAYQEAMRRDPKRSEPLLNYCALLLSLGREEDASSMLQSALSSGQINAEQIQQVLGNKNVK